MSFLRRFPISSPMPLLACMMIFTFGSFGMAFSQTSSSTPISRLYKGIRAYESGSFGEAISVLKSLLGTPKLGKDVQEQGYLYLIASCLQNQPPQSVEASQAVKRALEAQLSLSDTTSFPPSVREFIRTEVKKNMGTFMIDAEPYSAEVTVDGKAIGPTPTGITGLRPGIHQITCGGKRMVSELKSGERKQIKFKMPLPTKLSASIETESWSSHQGRSDFLVLGRLGMNLGRFTTSPLISRIRVDLVLGGHYYPGILSSRVLSGLAFSVPLSGDAQTPLGAYVILQANKDVYGYDPTTATSKTAPDGLSQAELGLGLEYRMKDSPFRVYFEQGAMAILSGTSLADKAMVSKVGLRFSR